MPLSFIIVKSWADTETHTKVLCKHQDKA